MSTISFTITPNGEDNNLVGHYPAKTNKITFFNDHECGEFNTVIDSVSALDYRDSAVYYTQKNLKNCHEIKLSGKTLYYELEDVGMNHPYNIRFYNSLQKCKTDERLGLGARGLQVSKNTCSKLEDFVADEIVPQTNFYKEQEQLRQEMKKFMINEDFGEVQLNKPNPIAFEEPVIAHAPPTLLIGKIQKYPTSFTIIPSGQYSNIIEFFGNENCDEKDVLGEINYIPSVDYRDYATYEFTNTKSCHGIKLGSSTLYFEVEDWGTHNPYLLKIYKSHKECLEDSRLKDNHGFKIEPQKCYEMENFVAHNFLKNTALTIGNKVETIIGDRFSSEEKALMKGGARGLVALAAGYVGYKCLSGLVSFAKRCWKCHNNKCITVPLLSPPLTTTTPTPIPNSNSTNSTNSSNF
eukprot:Pgem_evm1s1024